ncbi:hypothetical protein B6N60_03165 [Richelia sinica FACHB-800]|uniref:Uncharacterized protein n=1 Tax=Richelia sinica FACHB-800 TaxID=1357546 RepID=A0A975T995_9NOST|nr:hypothetical protein B6N60_03165 [Richelia sinica FACHB-800]
MAAAIKSGVSDFDKGVTALCWESEDGKNSVRNFDGE